MGIIYEKLKKCKKDLKLINEDIKAIERKGEKEDLPLDITFYVRIYPFLPVQFFSTTSI